MHKFLQNKILKNASWIVMCRVGQSLFTLLIGMITARYLGPSNYGVTSYAASLTAFVVPIMQLGLNNILVLEIVYNPDEEGNIMGTALVMSFVSSLLCIVGIVAFVSIVNAGETETIIVCALYSLLLIFQAIELMQYWFQAKYLSKYTSIVMLVSYILVSLYKIFLLVTKKNVYWFAVSHSVDYLIIAISLIIIYKKLGGQRLSFSLKTAKRMFSKSKYYIVSNLTVAIFAQTDKIMIKLMIDSNATGYYSAAVACAGMAGFVFMAIIDSFRPTIIESYKKDKILFESNVELLYSIIIYICLLYSVGVTVFSKLIINILYGASFSPAISSLRIIVWYSTFSYMSAVRNIWILAEQKHKYLWIINFSGAILNIIINYFLIPLIGINGAAIASLATQIFNNVIINFLIKPMQRNNVLLFRGANPMILINFLRSYLQKERKDIKQ